MCEGYFMKYRSARAERLENRLKRIAAAQLVQRKLNTYQQLLREDPLKLERFTEDEAQGNYVRFVGWKVYEDMDQHKKEWNDFKIRDYYADQERVVENAVLTNAAPDLVLE
jgi:hypothetical protein